MNSMLETIYQLVNEDSVLLVHRAFVGFTGDIHAGMFLERLLWLTRRSRDGWVYHTAQQWHDDLYMSRRDLEKAQNTLKTMGILETEVRKVKGSPITHYILGLDAFLGQFHAWVRENSQNLVLSDITNGFVIYDKGSVISDKTYIQESKREENKSGTTPRASSLPADVVQNSSDKDDSNGSRPAAPAKFASKRKSDPVAYKERLAALSGLSGSDLYVIDSRAEQTALKRLVQQHGLDRVLEVLSMAYQNGRPFSVRDRM